MDRRTFSFRQTVRHSDLNGLQDDLQQALHTQTRDLLGVGILTGGQLFAMSQPDTRHVLLAPTQAWDDHGRRLHLQHRLTDCVQAVVPLSLLRDEGIQDIPEGDGTLLLLAQPFAANGHTAAFALKGKTALLGNAARTMQPYPIADLVTTTLGGLVDQQQALLLTDTLPPAGYTAGVAPTGTSFIVDILGNEPLQVDVSHDSDGNDLLPAQQGSCRIVSLYARFAYKDIDWRLDGHGNKVAHRNVQHFQFVIDATAPIVQDSAAQPPALRNNGDLLLADIRLQAGQTIQQQDIDISRQVHLHNLQSIQPQHTAELLHMTLFGDGLITWQVVEPQHNDEDDPPSKAGTLKLTNSLSILLPDSATTHTLPAFEQQLPDKHALWVVLPRQASKGVSLATTVLPIGKIPLHTPQQIAWQLARRCGDTLYGWPLGRLQSGSSRYMGDGWNQQDYQTLYRHQDAIGQLQKTQTRLKQQDTDTNERLQHVSQKLEKTQQQLTQKLKETEKMQDCLRHNEILSRSMLLLQKSSWKSFSFSSNINDLCPFQYGPSTKSPILIGVGNGIYSFDNRCSLIQGTSGYNLHTVSHYFPVGLIAAGDNGNAFFWEHCGGLSGSWRVISTGVSVRLLGNFFGNSLCLLVGEQGTILVANTGKLRNKSTNMFKQCRTPTQVTLRYAVSGANGFVVAGDGGTILFSERKDMDTWHMTQLAGGAFLGCKRLLWDPSNRCFCVLFSRGPNRLSQIYTSTDGKSWRGRFTDYGVSDVWCCDNLCAALYYSGECIRTGVNWRHWIPAVHYVGRGMGNRMVYDQHHQRFFSFQPASSTVWESPVLPSGWR